jgi:hypothetical protein
VRQHIRDKLSYALAIDFGVVQLPACAPAPQRCLRSSEKCRRIRGHRRGRTHGAPAAAVAGERAPATSPSWSSRTSSTVAARIVHLSRSNGREELHRDRCDRRHPNLRARLVAASVNTVSKACVAAFVGGKRLGSIVGSYSRPRHYVHDTPVRPIDYLDYGAAMD